jgi:sulfite exporter TauE/SafE
MGIKSVKVSYRSGIADISYDTNLISYNQISSILHNLGYSLLTGTGRQETNPRRVLGILALIITLYVLLQQFGILNLLVPSQLADTNMGYGMLFVIGLFTSIHCVAMCGGINLSQCIPHNDTDNNSKSPNSSIRPALLYNLGRVISYTSIGFLLGFIGLFLGRGSGVGLSTMFQGILKLFAGGFMVISGVNMLGIFPGLRNLQPKMPSVFTRFVGAEKAKSSSPLIVGLLNGLMPCGPLQSMQIVALASGNPLAGALSMFMFSLGTVPLMLGLGSIVSMLGHKFSQKVMSVGAILVVVLGLAMLSQGGSLSGLLPPNLLLIVVLVLSSVGVISTMKFHNPFTKLVSTIGILSIVILLFTVGNLWISDLSNESAAQGTVNEIQVVDGKQIVNSILTSNRYPNISVQVGTPVKWVIDAPQGSINGCNNRMIIPDYGIEYTFKTGENVIEFTPTETGTIRYSCWMGMIRANITVLKTN